MPEGTGFCCCTTPGCTYESDDFSGDLSKWTVDSGTWVNSGGVLTASGAGRIYCNTLHPASANNYRVTVAIRGNAPGDIGRVVINNGGDWAELAFGNTGDTAGRLRLNHGGTLYGSVEAPGAIAGTWIWLTVCVNATHIAVAIGGTFLLSMPYTATSSKVGLDATPIATPTVDFDNFKIEKDVADDSTCPACGESCTYFHDGFRCNPKASLGGPDWDFAAGTWNWSLMFLQTSASSARAIVQAANPSGVPHRISVYYSGGIQYGIRSLWAYRVFADYQGSMNHLYAEVRYSDAVSITVSLHVVSGGVDSLLWEHSELYPSSGVNVVELGLSSTKVLFRLGGFIPGLPQISHTESYTPTIARGGIGTGSVNDARRPAEFYGVRLLKHEETDVACTVWPNW